jgi:hypothetical protein
VDADPPNIRGRPQRCRAVTDPPARSTGVMGTACQEGILGNVGDPSLMRGRNLQQCIRYWSGRESERGVGPLKPGNAGGGKAPYFQNECSENLV